MVVAVHAAPVHISAPHPVVSVRPAFTTRVGSRLASSPLHLSYGEQHYIYHPPMVIYLPMHQQVSVPATLEQNVEAEDDEKKPTSVPAGLIVVVVIAVALLFLVGAVLVHLEKRD
jgi:hypothetical protein